MTEKEFLSKMILHHEDAISMSNEIMKSSVNGEVVSYATLFLAMSIINAQTNEIKYMKQLLTKL
jgi:uncharacterized protein (DUF305 family)